MSSKLLEQFDIFSNIFKKYIFFYLHLLYFENLCARITLTIYEREVGGRLLRHGRVDCGRILFRGRHAQFSESDPRSLAAGRAAGGGRAGSALI